MTALVTGASSGIGRDIARELCRYGIKVIITGRDIERLSLLKKELDSGVKAVIRADLSDRKQCFRLYEKVKAYNVDIVINNAGFGTFGEFSETDLDTEIDMIDVNITAVHILTKLFLRDFNARGRGYILNVASTAAFLPGPLMAAYYATKAYVLRLTQAIQEELRRDGSAVYVGAFCPGPVTSDFDRRAGIAHSRKLLSSKAAAKSAVKYMFVRKPVIVPSFIMSAASVVIRALPDSVAAKAAYSFQSLKK